MLCNEVKCYQQMVPEHAEQQLERLPIIACTTQKQQDADVRFGSQTISAQHSESVIKRRAEQCTMRLAQGVAACRCRSVNAALVARRCGIGTKAQELQSDESRWAGVDTQAWAKALRKPVPQGYQA